MERRFGFVNAIAEIKQLQLQAPYVPAIVVLVAVSIVKRHVSKV